ncbi:MAG: NAD+ synthase [Chloroflexota bacterium]|nr:NAD+ synthase [Chloroflexota bacterium]
MNESEPVNHSLLADQIVAWLWDRLAESSAERFVLGLSGGVDSATVCGLCARAAGAERVLGAIMPSNSDPSDAEHAALVAQAFGIETAHVDLTPVADSLLAALPSMESVSEEPARLAVANLRSRLRMTSLYYLANARGGIVVGTGNKSEALIGYYTKYGDGGVDLLPILDLYKHEVRGVAAAIGVPEIVITKAPSAGLWPGQTDEAEIGMSYDQLDAALSTFKRGETEDTGWGGDAALVAKVETLHRDSAHKRESIPSFQRDATPPAVR